MKHPDHAIPLAQRVFPTTKPVSRMLVTQFVTENVTGKTYFRFVSPSGQVEGYAGNAEDAHARILSIAAELGIEVYDDVIHVSI
jgi:hypothetical protein